MRSTLRCVVAALAVHSVAIVSARADVKYLPEGPGFIEITGAEYDLWRAGNLQPSTKWPHGACVTIAQGGCHCPNPNASGNVTSEQRILLVARRVDRCPGIPSLASGTFNLILRGSGTWTARVTVNRSGNAFSGSSAWTCCPGQRTDPIVQGQINGTTIQFTRDCRGQGFQGPCTQHFTGSITGPNEASGTWTHNGSPGGSWEIR